MKRDQKSSKEYPKDEEVSKEGDSSQDCDSFLCEVMAAQWVMERFPECPGQHWSILSKPKSWTVGAGTPELEGFCSDASRLRLAGRTLPAGRLPGEAAVELAGQLVGYWLDLPENCQEVTSKWYWTLWAAKSSSEAVKWTCRCVGSWKDYRTLQKLLPGDDKMPVNSAWMTPELTYKLLWEVLLQLLLEMLLGLKRLLQECCWKSLKVSSTGCPAC